MGLESVLTTECARHLTQLRLQSTLFSNTGSRETTREFSIQYGGKTTKMRAGFGAVYLTTSNLLGILDSTSGKLKADLDNPTVRKILKNGGSCFVLSTLYEAEKVEISVGEDITPEGKVSQWKTGTFTAVHKCK